MEAKTEKNEMGGCVETSRPVQVSTDENIKVCSHGFCDCVSRNGYMCLHNGPCDPVNEHGRHYTVHEIVTDQGTFTNQVYAAPAQSAISWSRKPVAAIIDSEAEMTARRVQYRQTHHQRPVVTEEAITRRQTA